MNITELEREMTQRQSTLELKIPSTATVVGCGGTGFWTALFLAMSGVRKLVLIDPDKVETSNLNRLPLTPSDVGRYKVVACRDLIQEVRPYTDVETHIVDVSEETVGLLTGVIFCCTDNIKSQQLVYTYCKRHEMPYQRIGYDGTVLNVSRLYPMTLEEVEDTQNGYEVTPSWVCPASAAAALGVASQLYKEITLLDDLSLLRCEGWGIIPKVNLLNLCLKAYSRGYFDISDIDDGYGLCDDCDRGNCNDCDRGYCPDCDRGDCERCTVGDDSYTRGFDEGFDEGDSQGYDRGYKDGETEGSEYTAKCIIEHLMDIIETGENKRLSGLELPDNLIDKLDDIVKKLLKGGK